MKDFVLMSAPRRWTRATVFAALTAAAIVQASAQTVIYTEHFPNSLAGSNTGVNFGTVGWNAHIGPTAQNYTNTTALESTDPAVIWYTSGQGSTGPAYGFSANTQGGSLFWTTEIGSLDQNLVDSISFWSNNTNVTAELRIAIRLDNNTPANLLDDVWFATSTAFVRNVGTQNGSSGNWATNGELEFFSFTNAASAWRNLTFNEGVSLSLGTVLAQDLPGGNINAVGLYATGSGVRFDTFQVSIPEPSTLVLSAGALVGLLGIRRRRR